MNQTNYDLEHYPDITELREELEASALRLTKKVKMALRSVFVLAMCAFATFLYTDKGPFHAYWKPYGLVADVLSMLALLPACVFCGFVWVEWSSWRAMRKDLNELVEDRTGVQE